MKLYFELKDGKMILLHTDKPIEVHISPQNLCLEYDLKDGRSINKGEVMIQFFRLSSKRENKKTLFYLHGTGSSSTLNLGSSFKHLYKEFDIIGIDIPGFGRSSINGDFIEELSKE
jgi:pimeloyl-ACP methyl ester carboxylesterase